MMLAPDYASQHYQFALECLVELEDSFRKIGLRLGVAHSPMLEVLECLRDEHGSFELWSHEETGNGLSYQRDLAVGLCADRKASYGMNSRAMGWFGVSPVAIAGRGFGPNE